MRGAIGRDYATYFARPYAAAKTGALMLAEILRERHAAVRQARDHVEPRIHRSRMYAVVRAWATVIQRDLQIATVVGDMMAGRPVIYTTFLAYDEVAHLATPFGISLPRERLVQVDVTEPGDGVVIGQNVVRELMRGAELLHQL